MKVILVPSTHYIHIKKLPIKKQHPYLIPQRSSLFLYPTPPQHQLYYAQERSTGIRTAASSSPSTSTRGPWPDLDPAARHRRHCWRVHSRRGDESVPTAHARQRGSRERRDRLSLTCSRACASELACEIREGWLTVWSSCTRARARFKEMKVDG